MEPTKAAILARFDGDRKAAWKYCRDLSCDQKFKNEGLANEYWKLAESISAEIVVGG
jgi:hypothetical protein